AHGGRRSRRADFHRVSLMPTRRRLRDWLSRDHLYISVPALILVMGAFVVAWSLMKPAPPRRLAMASGPPDGIYYQMGLRYRALLAREGITLDVRTTSGSVENVGLLEDAANGVDAAFVQGGVLTTRPSSGLLALGTLYLEPFWVFTRAAVQGTELHRLDGKRLAVGPPGSGTRALAELLLRANGVTSASARLPPLTGLEGVAALERGPAATVHGARGSFELSRQIPSPDRVDVPLRDEARRYYQAGPPVFIRYLPFWAATLVDRLKIMLVPLIAVLFPLIKIAPSVYQWRV